MKKILMLFILVFVCSNMANAFECQSNSECLLLGQAFIKEHKYSKAIKCFDNAILLKEKNSPAYAYRAAAKFSLKDYEGAFNDASKSLEIIQTPYAYVLRASSKLAFGNVDGCIEDATMALFLNPNYIKAYEIRGRAMIANEDYFNALEDMGRALKIDNIKANVYEIKARSEAGLKDYKTAVKDFETASKLFKEQNKNKESKLMKKLAKKYQGLILK